MKRIVFAVTNDLSYDQRMQRICASLHNAGYTVELIGRQRKQSAPLEQKSFLQRRLRCVFIKGPFFYAEYNIRLFFLLLGHRADIFGACDLDTALAVSIAAKMKKRKSVFDAHEHFSEVPEVERRKFVKSIWHAIGKWCIPRFHLRYTVGESLAEVLTREYKAPFSVIMNVPALNESPLLPADKRENLIVYQGALNEGRGLEHAITAMKQLPEFRLRMIGEGDLSQQLRDLSTKLGLDDRVEFEGYVLPRNIYASSHRAMVGLNLLEARSKSYYYSLANKFFDYMHAGVPSVNMAFPEYMEIIGRHPVGLCIEKLSADTIAETIKRVSGDKEQREDMVAACDVARRIYCWQHEEQHLLSLISPLIS